MVKLCFAARDQRPIFGYSKSLTTPSNSLSTPSCRFVGGEVSIHG